MKDNTRAVTLADLDGRSFATVPEVASVLGCDERTVRAALGREEIPGTRIGATWRIPVAWLRSAAGGGHPAAP